MNNILIGVIGGTYWVNEAATSQGIGQERNFTEHYHNRIEQINRVHKVTEVFSLSAQEQNKEQEKEREFFRTEMMDNGSGEHSVVTVSSPQGFRQIHLDGITAKETEQLINPVKIQNAYFRNR